MGIIALGLTLGVVVSVALSVWGRKETFSLWMAIGLLFLLASGSLVVHTVKKAFGCSRKIDIFSPSVIFPLTFAFIVGVGSLPTLVPDVDDYAGLFPYYFVGIGAYFMGLIFMQVLLPWKTSDIPFQLVDTWDRRNMERALLFIFGLGALAVVLFALQAKLPLFAADVINYRFYIRQRVVRAGTLLNLSLSMQVVFIVACLYGIKYREKKGRKGLVWLMAGLSLASLLVWASRGRVIIPLLTSLLLIHYLKKRMKVGWILSFFAVLFLVFSFAGMRRLQTAKPEFRESVIRRSWSELHVIPRNFLVLKENFPGRFGFFRGKVLSYPLTTILPGYQPQIAETVKEKLGLGFAGGGFAFSLIGGLYLDFGMASVAAGMFLLGAFLQFLYLKMSSSFTELTVLLYAFTAVRSLDAIRSYLFLNFSYLWVVFLLVAVHLYGTKKHHALVAVGQKKEGGGR